MPSTTIKGLTIFDGTPAGSAGQALNNNFTALANRSGPAHSHASDPGATDDVIGTGGNGIAQVCSVWRNTSTNKFWICTDSTTGAAVWKPVNQQRDITFGLLGNLTVANDQTNHVIINQAATVLLCRAIAKTAPTGTDAILVIKKNGSTTIATITLTAGQTSVVATPSGTLIPGDYLSIDVTQIGGTIAGADVNITLTLY